MNNNLSLLIVIIFSFLSIQLIAQVDHSGWNTLLTSNVSNEGKVSYKGFISEKAQLDAYLTKIASEKVPSDSEEALAFWINAYNAYTVKLVISNWPMSSIKDVSAKVGASTPWDYSFAEVAGKTYTLNHIEHEIIRKQFDEPRIHFAVNCAAKSCPPLLNRAYEGTKVKQQLATQAKKFINNKSRNSLSANAVTLSRIFEWFNADFVKNQSLISFINKYADIKVSESATVNYNEYSWKLNN